MASAGSGLPKEGNGSNPRVMLICHAEDRIDAEGLASWLAATMSLVGMVALREEPGRMLTRVRREIRRVGILRFLDVLAFRVYYHLWLARSDATWMAQEVSRLRWKYPANLDRVPRLVAKDPNSEEVRCFLQRLQPDVMIARCKFILKPEIFTVPSAGTFVLHPGICPEYRNAHGCFWALVNRDFERVGMTLLRADKGVDTGPTYLHATYPFDEIRESHVVIQYRVVLENLEAIGKALLSIWRGERQPIPVAGRKSGAWGQPWLSAYARWQWAARSMSR